MIDITKIGETIKKAREEKRYTQQYLAQHLGISQKAYSKIENSQTNLTINHLDKIAQVLETPINQLLDTENKTVYNNYHTHNGEGIVIKKESAEKTLELYERMIKTQSDDIEYLKIHNETLLKTIESLAGKKIKF